MVRPRRALRGVSALPLARQLIIFATVPAVIVGAAMAGLFLFQQNRATPQAMNVAGAPTQSESQSAKVAKAVSDCRREVGVAESVLAAADNGVRNWRERVDAQSDYSLRRISEKKAKEVWKRTGQAGPSDIAKYQTAKSSLGTNGGACGAAEGAENAQKDQLATCRTRLESVRSALIAADLTMKDWEIHLAATPSDTHLKRDPEGVWLEAWRNAPRNLGRYSDAMDTLAKTKSCPR